MARNSGSLKSREFCQIPQIWSASFSGDRDRTGDGTIHLTTEFDLPLQCNVACSSEGFLVGARWPWVTAATPDRDSQPRDPDKPFQAFLARA
eukprot:2298722-Rhodomonas_salina.8